jgi:hypothetical protein
MLGLLHILRAARGVLIIAALLVGSAAPSIAGADSSGASGKAKNAQAQAIALFKEAQSLRKAGEPRQALAKLEEAFELLPTPTLLWPIAELRLQLGQPVEGLEALRRYRQDMAPADMEPGQQLADADKLEEKLRAQLAYLRPIAPAGAMVSIDGKDVGAAPLAERLTVNPGSHHIVAVGKGSRSEAKVELHPAQDLEVALKESEKTGHGGYFPHPLTWAAIGVTTAFLLASTVVGGIALTETRNLDAQCSDRLCVAGNVAGTLPDIAALNSDVSTQRSHALAAKALLGVTPFLAAGTAALIIFDWQRQKAGRTLLSERRLSPKLALFGPFPTAEEGGAGLALGGRF